MRNFDVKKVELLNLTVLSFPSTPEIDLFWPKLGWEGWGGEIAAIL